MTRSNNAATPKYFVAIDVPYMTFVDVVHGLLENDLCRSDAQVRIRYTSKVFSVLRLVAKGLRRLHSVGLVHGNVTLKNCAKYGDQKWKVANLLGCYETDEVISISTIPLSSIRLMPPEGFIVNKTKTPLNKPLTYKDIRMNKIVASTSMDSWAFGRLAYEVLTGQALFRSDSMLFPVGDMDVDVEQSSIDGLISEVLDWSVESWASAESYARKRLESAKVPKSGINLIVQCLTSDPEQRPQMDEIINHSVWKDLRKLRI
jgi:serine/threonine protein kinase